MAGGGPPPPLKLGGPRPQKNLGHNQSEEEPSSPFYLIFNNELKEISLGGNLISHYFFI